jgi:ABC-type glutathione transport system ATPase component
VIAINQLTVVYRSHRGELCRALSEVSLTIGEGEVVGLLGESGSGKSTLGLAICDALPNTVAELHGSIRWNAALPLASKQAQDDVGRQGQAAIIPQSPSLVFSPYLRCGQQVQDVLCARGIQPRQARLQTCQLFAEAGLPAERDAIHAYPHELSGGELQRVAIARALAFRPRLLVADEASSALDLLQAVRLQKTLLEINQQRGLAILWITHDPRELPDFSHRVLVIEQGRLVDQITGAAFVSGHVNFRTRRYLDALPGNWAGGAQSPRISGSQGEPSSSGEQSS